MNDDTPLLSLLALCRSARDARSAEELGFLAVNDTHQLHPYRQALMWQAGAGITALSGVLQVDANVPYVQWAAQVAQALHGGGRPAGPVQAADLPPTLAAEWAEWLPAHGLWLPMGSADDEAAPAAGLLLAADVPWSDAAVAVLAEWVKAWHHAWCALTRTTAHAWAGWQRRLLRGWHHPAQQPWWRQRRAWAAVAALAVCAWPVRLSVLAPGELVPVQPAVVRAPIDGVIDAFHVRPNEAVKAGQPLFGFDEAALATRLEVAVQAQSTALAEYRQMAQQAVSDGRSKTQLSVLLGKIAEKKSEADYLREQLQRARVLAPQDGLVLLDDPSEWLGRPVQTGERILRVARPGDVEVEAWVPLADAIPLAEAAAVTLYLAADPLSSLPARTRYLAFEATPRPEGHYAYRLRARLEQATDQRVGLKGTVRLDGPRVPLIYWVLRRPWALARQTLGW